MSKIKNGGLDQYVAGSSKREQFGTADVEGVKLNLRVTVLSGVPESFMSSTAVHKLGLDVC